MFATAQSVRCSTADHFDLTQQFIESCKRGDPGEKLSASFHDAMDRLGFRYFALCSHVDPLAPPPSAVMRHNYPERWAEAFSEDRLYEIDPMLLRAEQSPFPFHWDDREFRAQHTDKQMKLVAAASSLGLRSGYTIPIHLSWVPGALRASCSLVPASSSIDPRSYDTAERLSTYFYAAAIRASLPCTTGRPIVLSPRERQCLELVAQGKSEWVIAKLLGLHQGTVHKYIERTRRRLGVATRVQAVVKALQMGLISLGDVIRVDSRETNYTICEERLRPSADLNLRNRATKAPSAHRCRTSVCGNFSSAEPGENKCDRALSSPDESTVSY